jgi:hypothetical protein
MATALSRCGLRLAPADWKEATLAIGLSIAGVTTLVVLLDCVFFRAHLQPQYVEFFTSPLKPRVLPTCFLAIVEEIKFRLLVMTGLAAAIAALWRRTPPAWCFVLIIVSAHFADVGALVLHDPVYGSLRYLAVGSVWGWLYWRYGWLSALIGHVATHLLLDPLLVVWLS